jgi:agmatinase
LRDFGGSSDLGDLLCDGQVSTTDIKRIAQLTATIVAVGAFPVLLGGDHRVFEGLVRGVSAAPDAPAIISVSDKITLPPAIDAAPLPLAGLATASADRCPVLCIGVNGLQSAASWDDLHAVGGGVISADELYEARPQAVETINSFIAKNRPCVCCVDLEVVDSGHAAGTPSVNVGGATPEQLIGLLSEIDISTSLAGIAITNVAPKLDARGLTELAAAKALLALLDSQLFTEAVP